MAAQPSRRLLVTEPLDPDAAMYRWLSPDLEALGWQVKRFPIQQAVLHLGAGATRRLLVSLTERFRPDAVLVHPPYDFLDEASARRVRRSGSRLIGFAFDDAIFRPLRRSSEWHRWLADVDALYDLYVSTDPETVEAARHSGATRVVRGYFAASPAAFERVEAPEGTSQVSHAAVLIGRAYPRRVGLVRALAKRGIALEVFGWGWQRAADAAGGLGSAGLRGPLSRATMLDTLGRAGVVITTGDWESSAVPMVKYRLLEAAFCGAFQVAQACPDLREYFPSDEVPAYRTTAELGDLLQQLLAEPERRRRAALRAHERALIEHRWSNRWPELIAHLDSVGRPLEDPRNVDESPEYAQLLWSLGLAAEQRAQWSAAIAYYEAALAEHRADPEDLDALGRALYGAGRAAESSEVLARAIAQRGQQGAASTRGLWAQVPNHGEPPGLGRARYLDADAERIATRIAACLDAAAIDQARILVDQLADDDLIVTVAALLESGLDPAHAPIWRRLFSRALAAAPVQQQALREDHADRWREALDRIGDAS